MAEFTKNTGFCDVKKVFRKDCSFYEILKACGVSREISTSASKKQGLSPAERFIPVNAKWSHWLCDCLHFPIEGNVKPQNILSQGLCWWGCIKRWDMTTYDLNRLERKPFTWFFLLFMSSLPSQGEAETTHVSEYLWGETSHTSA